MGVENVELVFEQGPVSERLVTPLPCLCFGSTGEMLRGFVGNRKRDDICTKLNGKFQLLVQLDHVSSNYRKSMVVKSHQFKLIISTLTGNIENLMSIFKSTTRWILKELCGSKRQRLPRKH